MSAQRANMRIMGATLLYEIPFAMLVPHENRALKNHYQTLERLAERGGLGVAEAIAILEDRKFASVATCIENEHYLINLVRIWRKKEIQ